MTTLRELLSAVQAHALAVASGANPLPELPEGVTDEGGGRYDVDVLGEDIVQADIEDVEGVLVVFLYYNGGILGIEEDDDCPVTLTRVTGLTNEGEELDLDAFDGFTAAEATEATDDANPRDGTDGTDGA